MKQRFKHSIIISTLLLCSSILHAGQIYKMEDLRVLAKNKNFHEFFAHSYDILPRFRDVKWKALNKEMVDDYFSVLNKQITVEDSQFKVILTIANWPIFRGDELFNEHRDRLFVKQITKCYTKDAVSTCDKLAEKLFFNFKHHHSFAFTLLAALPKRVSLNQANMKLLWKFARPLVQSKYSEFYCNKSPLKNIVIKRLLVSSSEKIHSDCLKVIKPTLLVIMNTSKEYFPRFFKALEQKGLLTQEERRLYSIKSFMEGNDLNPKTTNKALAQLRLLGSDFELRSRVLAQLEKIDPLPDHIFSEKTTQDKKVSDARLRLLNRHFPEFINMYAQTCLDYLSGNKVFPSGNPTPNCHNFFSIATEKNYLSPAKIKSYKAATYFR